MDEYSRFSDYVSSQLGTYVYRLIDPRTGETFYVGKGQGNRVFAHAAGKLDDVVDEPSEKLRWIREIIDAGFKVAHVIHRHGLDDATALEVEAALMDAYPGITNIQGGYGSAIRGVMHATEVIRLYEAKEAEFAHNIILINVNKSAGTRDLLDAVRYAWKISIPRAQKAQFVFAVQQGIIRGVYVADEWLPATEANLPGFPRVEPSRVGFRGREAPQEIKDRYLYKRVPDRYRKKGARSAIRYVP
jgi:uncharacterized protein